MRLGITRITCGNINLSVTRRKENSRANETNECKKLERMIETGIASMGNFAFCKR